MATKQERLYEHARELGQVIPSDSQVPTRITFDDLWTAQAEYLDQHFIERTLADERLQTWGSMQAALILLWEHFPESVANTMLDEDLAQIRAVLEATKEE